jgi:betaine-aldehyde dehydrogenase
VSTAGEGEIEASLSAAREAFDNGPWPRLPLAKRKEYIQRIADGILEEAGELANLESLNSGKPIKETTFMDIPSSAEAFSYFAQNFEKLLAAETLAIESAIANVESDLIYEPRGVAVLIVPWNYPLLIASWKMAQALAAGNCLILKTSSLTPLSVFHLAKIIDKAGLPKGVVNIITGKGEVVGSRLCADNRVDMISFTGSNPVGKSILKNTSRHIKKLLMELGGKSASIILKDADIDIAVNSSLCSIFLNQGQMCTAMSRILIEEDIYGDFIERFTDKAKRIKLGPAGDFQTQMGPLISASQRDKVGAFVKEALENGAKVLCGGKAPEDKELEKGFFFSPTVISDITPQMNIFQEEVFGPVACLSQFSSLDGAIDLANNSQFALAASIWTKDKQQARFIAENLEAGTVWVNTYGMFLNELPYGGFKQSGFGKELGKEGLREYSRLKNIIADQSCGAKPLVSYWYGF